MVVREKIP